jgi:flagellar protein FlaG
MSIEIGSFTPIQAGYASPRVAPTAPTADFAVTLAGATEQQAVRDVVDIAIPPSPPEHVQDEIAAARDRASELARSNRELHFSKDEESGRVVVQVRDLEGNVIRTIPPSEALAVMSGQAI